MAKATAERGLKAKLIREGLEKYKRMKPKAIAEQLTLDHPDSGVVFRPVDVSFAKFQKKKKARARRNAKASTPTDSVSAPSFAPSTTLATTGLAPADVETLAALAKRAGGITPLVEMLEALKSFSGKGK